MNQCWDIVSCTHWNTLQRNINRNSYIFIQENTFENVVCEMSAILSRSQCSMPCLCLNCVNRTSTTMTLTYFSWNIAARIPVINDKFYHNDTLSYTSYLLKYGKGFDLLFLSYWRFVMNSVDAFVQNLQRDSTDTWAIQRLSPVCAQRMRDDVTI